MIDQQFYLGVDPGKNGGLALLNAAGEVVRAQRLADTPTGLAAQFRVLPKMTVGLLEFVRSRPRMSSVAVFTFGRGYGRIEVALAAAGIPYQLITPRSWQTAMACLSGGDKTVTKQRAKELFPASSVTHAVADALLLAECCRRMHTTR